MLEIQLLEEALDCIDKIEPKTKNTRMARFKTVQVIGMLKLKQRNTAINNVSQFFNN